ncbi:TPA: oligosaccharide flippase family protein, partial [Escherichia coli]|nr:oligosaccharide flippase family protein [Escherichia coli]
MNFVLQILYLILANSSRFIIPILFLPLSARLLSNSDFEALSITISFATWVAIVIEFGFNYSSAKQIKYDSNKVKVISVINSTLSAKIILSLLAIILGIYTSFYVGKTHFIYVLLFWLYS